MRNLILIFLLFLRFSAFGQTEEIDSCAIKFKANLLTVSEYGIASKQTILNDIESQEVEFLKTKYKNFFFLRIRFSQPYRTSESGFQTLDRDCYYYIAYNIRDKKFYRLGGFDSIDIDSFINDLQSLESNNIIDWEERNEIQEIDIDCLFDYYNLSPKKRLKRKFKCFENCSENTRMNYREY